MKAIPLTQGEVALVDDEDYESISKHKWCASWNRYSKTFYAVRHTRGQESKCVIMHRQILRATKGQEVDHRDHDGLNNQRSNIRLCSRTENMHNLTKHADGSSPFKGVILDKRSGCWESKMMCRKKRIWLGCFGNPLLAAMVYDAGARKFYGDFAKTNFFDSDSLAG